MMSQTAREAKKPPVGGLIVEKRGSLRGGIRGGGKRRKRFVPFFLCLLLCRFLTV
jgi:hypothetical protein